MEVLPLTGFTVGLTADRRREELATLLNRRGATVLSAPALHIVPVADDAELHAATQAVLGTTPDVVIAMTGIGFRGWMEAADGWGLGDALRRHLAGATIVARGPKATGAVRAAGLDVAWSPASEASSELMEWLHVHGLAGRTVIVQEHGAALPELLGTLRHEGARVVQAAVYRWAPPRDTRPVLRLIDAACNGQLDALAFTSAPAVTNVLSIADSTGRLDVLLEHLRERVLVACVGSVCAEPLERLGVTPVRPARARLGALVRTLVEELPQRILDVSADGHRLVVRGQMFFVDGHEIDLAPAPAAVLRVLVRNEGRVLSRSELLRLVWPDPSVGEHAVEMTLARLRRSLGSAGGAVQTVPRRGYRLRTDLVGASAHG